MVARVSAARALAQQLSEEKQVALTAARLAAEWAADQKELARWISVLEASLCSCQVDGPWRACAMGACLSCQHLLCIYICSRHTLCERHHL